MSRCILSASHSLLSPRPKVFTASAGQPHRVEPHRAHVGQRTGLQTPRLRPAEAGVTVGGCSAQQARRVVIAAQTGISGSVTIEDDVVIGGQVGFGDHIRVLSGAVIGSKAGVLPGKIVRPGVWWGIPIQPLDQYKRMNAHLGRLPQMRDEIKQLKKEIAELRQRLEKTN